jgi:hypothetical protein
MSADGYGSPQLSSYREEMSEPEVTTPQLTATRLKRVRVRKKRLDIQLQESLNTASSLMQAEPSELAHSKIKLCQVKIVVLSKAIARDRNDKLKKALAEVTRLTGEVAKLKAELQARAKSTPQVTDIDRFLEKHGLKEEPDATT